MDIEYLFYGKILLKSRI